MSVATTDLRRTTPKEDDRLDGSLKSRRSGRLKTERHYVVSSRTWTRLRLQFWDRSCHVRITNPEKRTEQVRKRFTAC